MTTEFQKIQFDPGQCRKEAEQLRDFLATHPKLQERKHVLPFFKQRLQLSAFLGSYHPEIVRYDLVAHELPLFGDFVADLVVGDSKNSAFAFIEFEDASPGSIFTKKKKGTPEWSSRFEHGFSQLVDWFFKLHEQGHTVDFEAKFGSRTIRHLGILVIGRTADLGTREAQRLRWRQEHLLLNSKQIHCKTFDQLRDDLLDRLEQFLVAAKVEEQKTAAETKAEGKATAAKSPAVEP
ncbi:MAG TPA: Shedu immune nuclease family protein [Gemmataceae bacterium]|nr:Shedu immune nuclease family protein [Gemmataceae bacterium]